MQWHKVHSYSQFLLLIIILLATLLIALTIGNYPVHLMDVMHFVSASLGWQKMAPQQWNILDDIVVQVRFPRILAAILVGMALATAGSAYQAIFRNPLVSPGILGVLAGSAFGATLAMLLNQSDGVLQIWAFGFGLFAVVVGIVIGQLFGSGSLVMLILGGMISSALFSALLSIVKYVADPQDQLPSITYWLMGSLGRANLTQSLYLAIPIGVATVVLWLLGRALDVMSMGDQEAKTLGVPVVFIRYLVIALATLISALSVSIAGMIGWIGLLAPHVARLLVGPSNSRLLPASTILGAVFLVIADCIARSVAAVEIPIGIITECLGLPMFILVLHRVKKGWN